MSTGNLLVRMYAIQERGTRKFLCTDGKKHKAYTHDEPEKPWNEVCYPRLFLTEVGAITALKAWKKGKHFRKNFSHSFEEGEQLEVKQVEARKKIQLEVVPIMIMRGT